MITKSERIDFESYLQDAANIMGNCEKVYLVETEDEISEMQQDVFFSEHDRQFPLSISPQQDIKLHLITTRLEPNSETSG